MLALLATFTGVPVLIVQSDRTALAESANLCEAHDPARDP
jgi:hypothetical protein